MFTKIKNQTKVKKHEINFRFVFGLKLKVIMVEISLKQVSQTMNFVISVESDAKLNWIIMRVLYTQN